MLCVGKLHVDLGERNCFVFGRVWCGFGGVILCCVNDSSLWVWGSLCVLFAGQYFVGLGSECVLGLGQIRMDLAV